MYNVAYHAFISMRQQHDDATLANPLRLAAANELVKDALCRVSKVTELSLPNHQRIRIAKGVANLKTCRQVDKYAQPFLLTITTNTSCQH